MQQCFSSTFPLICIWLEDVLPSTYVGGSHALLVLSQVTCLSQTPFRNQQDQFKVVTKLLIRQNVPFSACPQVGLTSGWSPTIGSWWGCHLLCSSPWSFSSNLASQGGWAGCLLLAWPVLGCISHVCCLMVAGRFQLCDHGVLGMESPLSHGSLRKRQSFLQEGAM